MDCFLTPRNVNETEGETKRRNGPAIWAWVRQFCASILDSRSGRSAIVIAGIVTPLIVVTVVPYAHRHDLENIRAWGKCLAEHGGAIYEQCDIEARVNYPAVGILATAGAARTIEALSESMSNRRFRRYFRYYVAIFDAMNFLLFVSAARLLKLRRPELVGLLLMVVPSTVFGGAVWGQVDSILLFTCLVCAVAALRVWRLTEAQQEHRPTVWPLSGWLLLVAVSGAFFILVKQLSIFSIPFLIAIALVSGLKLWRIWGNRAVILIAGSVVTFAALFAGLDRLIFEVPTAPGGSGYYYVWTGGGSDHGDKISGNGFNIWIFLGRGMLASAHEPMVIGWGTREIWNVSPFTLGIVLYGSWMLFLTITGIGVAWHVLKQSAAWSGSVTGVLAGLLFLYHGLSYLGFNVLLTGTHERYMYVGYPFLLLGGAWFLRHRIVFTPRLFVLCVVCAFIYGWFVFSEIGFVPGFLFPFARPEFVASVHLFLLVGLADAWFRLWNRRFELSRVAQ